MATLSAQFCTPEEQRISALPNAPLHCLTRNESIALTFVAQSGVVSFLACLVTYGLIFRKVRYHNRRTPGKWHLIQVPMDIYLMSLFAAEIILSVSAFINAKWVQDGKTQIGGWCSAQGVTLTVGATSVALNTLAIAVHTFVMVWCNKGFRSNLLAWVTVSAIWLFCIVYVAVLGSLHRHEPDLIFRPTPYWCWIGKNFAIHRLFIAYIWIWIALFTSLLLYVPLFFWGRGNITVGDKPWTVQLHRRENVEDPGGQRRHSLSMIAYPLVYSCIILPLSVTRWIGFTQEGRGDHKNHVPPGATIAVQTIHCLSGICNVLLFLLTRPNLLLFRKSTVEILTSGNPAPQFSDADSIGGDVEK